MLAEGCFTPSDFLELLEHERQWLEMLNALWRPAAENKRRTAAATSTEHDAQRFSSN